MTLTELHDARIDVIAHARGVLDRARAECASRCGRGAPLLRVVAAMGVLRGALSGYDHADPSDPQAVDETVRDCGWKALQLVRIAEDVMGAAAAEYISGEGDPE